MKGSSDAVDNGLPQPVAKLGAGVGWVSNDASDRIAHEVQVRILPVDERVSGIDDLVQADG